MKKRICFEVSSVLTAKFFLRFHIEKLSGEYDVYLVGNFSDDEIKSISYFNLKGVKSIAIERKINVVKDLIAIKNFVYYINEMKFDAIHSLAPKAGLIAAIAGKITNTKNRIHIFTGQVWHTKKGLFKFLLKQLDKFIVLLNTKVLVDSYSQWDYLIKEGIINNQNSLVLGKGSISGVDFNRFSPNVKLKEQLREEFNISNDTVVFLFMGRINNDKGVFDLANSFYSLLSNNKNILLFFIGYDEEGCVDKIKKIIGDDKYFKYYGSTDYPEKYIHVGDVFCLPSYREGFGTSIIEASSCKLAIICSDTYGLKDTIIDGETGMRHEVGNVSQLKNNMEILASNLELIQLYGKNGYEYVQKNFSSNFVSNEWLKFYRDIFDVNK